MEIRLLWFRRKNENGLIKDQSNAKLVWYENYSYNSKIGTWRLKQYKIVLVCNEKLNLQLESGVKPMIIISVKIELTNQTKRYVQDVIEKL